MALVSGILSGVFGLWIVTTTELAIAMTSHMHFIATSSIGLYINLSVSIAVGLGLAECAEILTSQKHEGNTQLAFFIGGLALCGFSLVAIACISGYACVFQ